MHIREQATIKRPGGRQADWIKQYDMYLLGISIAILVFGLIMVASSSITIAERNFGDPLHYFWRQAISAMIGVVMAGIMVHIPVRFWQFNSMFLLILGLLLLILVLIPGIGSEVNGSMRWINLGLFKLQASELVKFCVIAYLAGYLVRHGHAVRYYFSGFIAPMAVLTLVAICLLMEPDFGTSIVLFITTLGMLFMAGVPLSRFIAWVAVLALSLLSLVILSPYRMQRVVSFMDPWSDPYDSGFQLTQALIAFGRGEWFGVGLGSGIQKLFYLPEAHTDFMFAVIAEETGLIGSVLLIALFLFLVWRAFSIGRTAERHGHLFSAFFSYGVGLLFGIQGFINMGVNMGVLPTKGLTLPLISYGGNSLIVCCMLLAVLIRIEYENRQHRVSPLGKKKLLTDAG